jgi:hypothetical protein
MYGPKLAEDTVATLPGLPASLAPSAYFRDAAPGLGISGSVVDASFLNGLLLEMETIIKASGQALQQQNTSQLLTAVRRLAFNAIRFNVTSTAGFTPGFNDTWTHSMPFLTYNDGKLVVMQVINSSRTQPIATWTQGGVQWAWSVENSVMVGDAVLSACNTSLSSTVIGAIDLAASQPVTVTGRLRTASPSSSYESLQAILLYLFIPTAA